MAFRICIPAGSIRLQRRKCIGHIGADIIYVNRYMDAPKPIYDDLLKRVAEKDYFVITTNVDHCFQKAGFDKKQPFYTQGDYGLFQCSEPCCQETFDNEAVVREMVARQENMKIPSELLPVCPHCGKPMTMNLRSDDAFVEDEGWHRAAERYADFLRTRKGQKILFLELGVGYNTPVIIKYPFWQMTAKKPQRNLRLHQSGTGLPRKKLQVARLWSTTTSAKYCKQFKSDG